MLTTAADINLLTIGPATTPVAQKASILGHLYLDNSQGVHGGVPSTKSGVLLQHIYRSVFNLTVFGFSKGILLKPPTSGCNYNTFYLGQIKNCDYGVYLDTGASTGNVNENTFYGGSFSTQTDTYKYLIYIPKGTGGSSEKPNNNMFFRPSLEGGSGTVETGYYDDGAYNVLIHPRLEMSQTLNLDAQAVYGVESTQCQFLWGRNTRAGQVSVSVHNIRDLGANNIIFANDGLRMTPYTNVMGDSVLLARRDSPNTDLIPAVLLSDIYEPSKDPMVLYTEIAREVRTGYQIECRSLDAIAGDPVIVKYATPGGMDQHYECIAAHTSVTATDEPGIGSSWETKWKRLNSRNANSASTWANGVDYVVSVVQFSVRANGEIWTDQLVADTSAPPATVAYKMEIFDQTGTSRGFIPVYATI